MTAPIVVSWMTLVGIVAGVMGMVWTHVTSCTASDEHQWQVRQIKQELRERASDLEDTVCEASVCIITALR